jgi:hypothetical protein
VDDSPLQFFNGNLVQLLEELILEELAFWEMHQREFYPGGRRKH